MEARMDELKRQAYEARKHTPGPWVAQEKPLINGQVCVNAPNHDRRSGEQGVMTVAHVNGRAGEQGANARLIAAAPDLLAALQYIAKKGGAL